MSRRSQPRNIPEELRQSLVDLLTNFAEELKKDDLRQKVVTLVPAFHTLRDLGSSLIPKSEASSARDRIIAYLKQYPGIIIDGDELMVVSGISEWARRVRELRVQFGWWIYSGVTFKQMAQNPDDAEAFKAMGIDPSLIKPDQYVLMNMAQDLEAAYRWNVLNEIRKKKIAVKEKIIEYLRKNVRQTSTGRRHLATWLGTLKNGPEESENCEQKKVGRLSPKIPAEMICRLEYMFLKKIDKLMYMIEKFQTPFGLPF